ncbi:MAG: T9SS type A sorting domain-containing protein, partial [Bacteroidota bacterium]
GTSTFTNFPSGRIVGSGTYDITTTLINEGMVVPGEESQIGTLDITNNFALNGGSIQLDISGTASGAFDKIAIIGSPDMNGTLAINLQFAPQLDDEFTVITWNLNGSNCIFPETATSIYDGLVYTFEINCNANDVTLRVSEISILGVEDITSSPQFYIQPNPVTDDAVFVFPSEWVPSEEISIVIYNFTGQEVMKLSNVSETTSFQRGNLPAGLYFAQLRESDRLLGTSKIVLE